MAIAPTSATQPPAEAAAPAAAEKPWAEKVNFNTIYYGLEQKGIKLSSEERATFEKICKEQLEQYNGQLLGSNVGASGVNLVYMLFAFIQNLFGNGMGNLSQFGEQLSGAASTTSEQAKLNQLNQATMAIHQKMTSAGGNLAAAAELVTGQQNMAGGQNTAPTFLKDSIYAQLRGDISLPLGTPTSLNRATTGTLSSPPPVSGARQLTQGQQPG